MSEEISAKDVYQAINGLRTEVREDQKEIWQEAKELRQRDDEVAKCVSNCKLDVEKNKGRLYTHDEKFKSIDKHLEDPKVHWNKELANEGAAGYVARNKLKILIISTITTIITIGGGLIITWLQSLGGA